MHIKKVKGTEVKKDPFDSYCKYTRSLLPISENVELMILCSGQEDEGEGLPPGNGSRGKLKIDSN